MRKGEKVCKNYCACVEENAETCEEVILIISEITTIDINKITHDSSLKRDLRMDREDILELETDLEEEFEIEIFYGSLLRGNVSVRDVVWKVLNCVAEKKGEYNGT